MSTSTGDIKYPEDIWKVARPIANDYQQGMAISALILAERQRCAKLCTDVADLYAAKGAGAGTPLDGLPARKAQEFRFLAEKIIHPEERHAATADIAEAIEKGTQP